MTAVELLIEQIISTYRIHLPNWEFPNKEYWIEMEKQQHGKTWDSAIEQFCKRGGNLSRASFDFDDYYDETYGSKGIDETKKN